MSDITDETPARDDRSWIKLKNACAEAERLTGKPSPGYLRLYRAALDGRIVSRRTGREVELHQPSLLKYIAAVG